MNGFMADLQHATRVYLRTPLSSALAVVVLAIAMAIVTGFLSLWTDLVLKPVPGFERGRDLITIGQTDGTRLTALSYALVERIGEETTSIDSIAGTLPMVQFYDRDGERTQLVTELVTASYFPDMRPEVELGRRFTADDHDPSAAPVVILSHAFWQEEYGGRTDVLGDTVTIHGPNGVIRTRQGEARLAEKVQDYRIVGVLAPAIKGTFIRQTDAWMPYEQAAEALMGDVGPGYRSFNQLQALARLAPGASVDAVGTELAGRYGDAGPELGVRDGTRFDAVRGLVRDLNAHRETLRQIRLFLAGSVLLAVVAACNVSLFLLSRAPGRRRELAIRMSVGAPLKRLARQLVTESGVLVATAVVIGIGVSLWLAAALAGLSFLRRGQWRDVTALDWRVLGLVFVLTLALTAFVSLAPVAGLKRLGLASGARAVSARAGPFHRLAGTLQSAIAAAIGAAAIAFVWYLVELEHTDRGFDAPNVSYVLIQPPTPPRDFVTNIEAMIQEREHRREAIAAIPGIEEVAFGTTVPGASRPTNAIGVYLPDPPDTVLRVDLHTIDRNYLGMIGATFLDGRDFEASDRDAVIINEALAERIWGRTDVSGEILPTATGQTPLRWEVVGVVGNIAFTHPAEDRAPMVFHSALPTLWYEWILVRSRLSNADVRSALQRKIDDGELDFNAFNVNRIEDAWNDGLAPDRARTWLTGVSALIVVALAAFGFYGTLRFLVAAGRREYAILAALGAGPRALGRLVLGRGVRLGLPGLVFGSLLAFIVVAWMRDDFVSADVSASVIAVVVGLSILALLLVAALGPARQARRTEPAPLLKEE